MRWRKKREKRNFLALVLNGYVVVNEQTRIFGSMEIRFFFPSLFVFRVEEKNVCILMRILFKRLITFLIHRLIHFEYLEIFVQFIQILENQLIVKLINNNFINNLWFERKIDYISVA